MRAYERRTRLYPALIVLLPVALGGISWAPPDLELRWAGGSLLLGLVVATLIAQLARDPGGHPPLLALAAERRVRVRPCEVRPRSRAACVRVPPRIRLFRVAV